jgi:histidinol-phosphate aminotransferase
VTERTFLPSRVHLDAVQPYRIPEFERTGFLRLDINEHPGGAPAFVVQAVHAALTSQSLATYPVYAEWHAQAAQFFGIQPSQVTCTAGGDEAIKALCEAHLLPGKALLTVEPGYDMFRIWAQLYGNPLRGVSLDPDFALDTEAWLAALTPDVGLVALVTPNNPTGTVIDRQVLEKTLERVQCPVLIDETYAEFVQHTATDLIARHPHLFIVRSFSKVHGLAGLRVGAILSQAQNIQGLRRVLNPFNVNRAAIAASLAVMRHPDHCAAHVAEVTAAREQFTFDLGQLGVRTGPATANFVLANLADRAAEVTERLAAEAILVRNRTGTHPRLDGYCRIAIGSPTQMRRAFGAIRKVLAPPPRLGALLLDFDGPMADVSHSYRKAILDTARALLARDGAPHEVLDQCNAERVEGLKRLGGLNNDWDCTAALIADLGGAVAYDDIVQTFQSLYWGEEGDGLIATEPWRLDAQTCRILTQFHTAIVTGRPRREALWTLQRHACTQVWPVVVAMEDMTVQKPAPDGILQALAQLGVSPERAAYLGDGVDDMTAARAAGVLPLGVLPATEGDAHAPWQTGLCERLYEAGAHAVFASVQEVLTWLQA